MTVIIFHGIGELKPQDDMTPQEAVCLNMMLTVACAGSNADLRPFVKEHGLERHFSPVTLN